MCLTADAEVGVVFSAGIAFKIYDTVSQPTMELDERSRGLPSEINLDGEPLRWRN